MENEKTKMEKHLEELGEQTSGGAHDAVTFSGKGLGFLRDLFKGVGKKKQVQDDDDMDDDMDDDEDEETTRKAKKNASKANGGAVEENEEDPADPADEEDNIIGNKGKRTSKDSLKDAVSKNARAFDERRFEKHIADHEEVYDASPALLELAKSVRTLGKSMSGTNESVEDVKETTMVLAKAVRELLKSNAALAADIELIKKHPVSSPATGFVVLNKQEGSGSGRRLSKSDIEDGLTDAVNEGLIEAKSLAQLGRLRSDADLKNFVDNLPASVREKL